MLTDGVSNGHSATVTQHDNVRPLLSLLDKEPPSRHVSGQLEYVRHLTGMEKHENMLPLLQASNERKTTNGLDFLMAEFAGEYVVFNITLSYVNLVIAFFILLFYIHRSLVFCCTM